MGDYGSILRFMSRGKSDAWVLVLDVSVLDYVMLEYLFVAIVSQRLRWLLGGSGDLEA